MRGVLHIPRPFRKCVLCHVLHACPLMNVFMEHKCSPLAVGLFTLAKLPCLLTSGTSLNTHFDLTYGGQFSSSLWRAHKSNPMLDLSVSLHACMVWRVKPEQQCSSTIYVQMSKEMDHSQGSFPFFGSFPSEFESKTTKWRGGMTAVNISCFPHGDPAWSGPDLVFLQKH